jgi:putative glutamine transport system permease protein
MIFFKDIAENFHFLMLGLGQTAQLTAISVSASLLLGIIIGILRYSRIIILSWIATIYIESLRSVPLILFIIFVHFGLLPMFAGESLSSFNSACVALTLFTSAYVAEIIRSGLNSIEKEHHDAAKSLGLSTMDRLMSITLPIAINRMTPALVSQFISLIKDTSLVSAIGVVELTHSAEIVYGRTYRAAEILIFVAFIYFVICFTLSKISKIWENKPYLKQESRENFLVNS